MGSAVAHGHAEALRRPDAHIGPLLPGWGEQGAGEQVRGHGHQPAGVVDGGDGGGEVAHHPAGARVLEEGPEGVGGVEVAGRVAHHHVDPDRFGPSGHHGDGLRVRLVVDEEGRGGVLGGAADEGHGLGGSRRLVQHRCAGDLHAGEVRHHRLEVQERLEPTLADLGLVRRVGRVPGRVLQHVALDHAGGVGAVVARAHQGGQDLVAVGEGAEQRQHLWLGPRVGQAERPVGADRLGNGLLDQLVERGHPEGGEHPVHVLGARPQVTVGEGGGGLAHDGLPGAAVRSEDPRCHRPAPALPPPCGPWA